MSVILVTGYVRANVSHRSGSDYAALGWKLLDRPARSVAFLDPALLFTPPTQTITLPATLDQCWYRSLCGPGVKNPVDCDTKDTLEYYAVQHQKSAWLLRALEITEADVAVWVDFGIFHLARQANAPAETPVMLSDAINTVLTQLAASPPQQILMPSIRPLPTGQFSCDTPQWFCAGGVLVMPRALAAPFDQAVRDAAREHIAATGKATWEVNTWAQVMQKHPTWFERYFCNHDLSLFTNFRTRAAAPMKIAVYALAKNEEKHAAAWAESCKEADYRVVTDTGSTDKTPDLLRAAGVSVHPGNVMPWRWDEAHNLSMHHVPSDADVCVRLDLDERFKPGWREAIEKAWKPGMTKLRYWYTWSMTPDGEPLKKFPSDRVHARTGYRWTGATHEGLVKWDGPEVFGWSDALEILHYREPGKKHSTDMELLKTAVREMPHDARMHWYLARQMDYENHPDTIATFQKYLDMPDGSTIERAYACRVLSRRVPDKAEYWLQRSIQEDPRGPEGYYELAKAAHQKKDHLTAYFYARQAVACAATGMMHTSDIEAFSHLPADIASVNSYLLGLHQEALRYVKIAVERNPGDERLKRNLEQLEEQLKSH